MKGEIIKELKELGIKKHPKTLQNLKHSKTSELIRLLEEVKNKK